MGRVFTVKLCGLKKLLMENMFRKSVGSLLGSIEKFERKLATRKFLEQMLNGLMLRKCSKFNG
jgi:hypothetical protein